MSPGERVTASIRLVRLLGQGGMGSIWIARHERLKTDVVVKFIIGEYASQPEVLARFEREASLAAQAKSPHVVQIFDYGVAENGLPYIAMEHLEGEDLAARIERDQRIDPVVFAEWFRQACAGLGRAHNKGIVHRDIKPENIFLCNEDGEVLVKLLDFGIARSDGGDFSATQTGAFMGTAYYMSPEQTLGAKNLDFRTDLWAMGVVAYYALTGKRPFQADAIGALVMAINSHDPARPSEVVPGLTPSLDGWMHRALAKHPDARFESAREMASTFVAAATGVVLPPARPSEIGPAPLPTPPTDTKAGTLGTTTLSPATGQGNEVTVNLPLKRRGATAYVAGIGLLAVATGGALFMRNQWLDAPVDDKPVESAVPERNTRAPGPAFATPSPKVEPVPPTLPSAPATTVPLAPPTSGTQAAPESSRKISAPAKSTSKQPVANAVARPKAAAPSPPVPEPTKAPVEEPRPVQEKPPAARPSPFRMQLE